MFTWEGDLDLVRGQEEEWEEEDEEDVGSEGLPLSESREEKSDEGREEGEGGGHDGQP